MDMGAVYRGFMQTSAAIPAFKFQTAATFCFAKQDDMVRLSERLEVEGKDVWHERRRAVKDVLHPFWLVCPGIYVGTVGGMAREMGITEWTLEHPYYSHPPTNNGIAETSDIFLMSYPSTHPNFGRTCDKDWFPYEFVAVFLFVEWADLGGFLEGRTEEVKGKTLIRCVDVSLYNPGKYWVICRSFDFEAVKASLDRELNSRKCIGVEWTTYDAVRAMSVAYLSAEERSALIARRQAEASPASAMRGSSNVQDLSSSPFQNVFDDKEFERLTRAGSSASYEKGWRYYCRYDSGRCRVFESKARPSIEPGSQAGIEPKSGAGCFSLIAISVCFVVLVICLLCF